MKNKKKYIILILLFIFFGLTFYPSPKPSPNRYVDRESGSIKTEKVSGENWLVWLYNNPVGEATMFMLAKRKMLSSIYGMMMNSPYSTKMIKPFVEEHQIDMSTAQKLEFNSFNDFFTRKLKLGARPIDTASNIIVSPADGKILAYDNISNSDFIIKGSRFDLSSFLDDPVLAQKYENGSLIIVRLAPYNYHRFHFPIDGHISIIRKIEGDLYSVNPIALKKMVEIFWQNKREYVVISTPNFGNVIMAEVGATMVGSIIKTYEGANILKGEEKGYFKFGGSTVVLLFEKDKIQIDIDLLENTINDLETSINTSERIAVFEFGVLVN